MKKYYDDVNYYDENDQIIHYVRDIQMRGTTEIGLNQAVKTAGQQSQYAQALRKGYFSLKAASDFFDGKISKDELYDALEVSKKSRF